jgi:hypothetical protein
MRRFLFDRHPVAIAPIARFGWVTKNWFLRIRVIKKSLTADFQVIFVVVGPLASRLVCRFRSSFLGHEPYKHLGRERRLLMLRP